MRAKDLKPGMSFVMIAKGVRPFIDVIISVVSRPNETHEGGVIIEAMVLTTRPRSPTGIDFLTWTPGDIIYCNEDNEDWARLHT